MQKVAIIGSGPSGLVAAKECLQANLEPTIFEYKNSIGGIWSPKNGIAWEGMKANLSIYNMGFSDFPWPQKVDEFPSKEEVFKYLEDYATLHTLQKHLFLESKVTTITYLGKIKQWEICIEGRDKLYFDNVIFCNGIFSKMQFPDILVESTKMDLIHSGRYTRASDFLGKKVVVIGGGFSGYEIAADLASSNIEVTHIFKRPCWIGKRYCNTGNGIIPLDLISYTHPPKKDNELGSFHNNQKNIDFFKDHFGNPGDIDKELNVDENAHLPQFMVISDYYLDHVKSKKIKPVCGHVLKVNSDHCLLTSGKKIFADIIIYCTGFTLNLDFLDKALSKIISFDRNNYFQPLLLNMATFHHRLPSAGFVGLYRGPFFGIMELQARWISAVFSSQVPQPTTKSSKDGILYENELRKLIPRPQFPRPKYVEFMYDLANNINAIPLDLLLENFSNENIPFTPADFRRQGLGANIAVANEQRSRLLSRLNI